MLTGTDLKVGQRIRLYRRLYGSKEFIDGTIVPSRSGGSPLFIADKEFVEWLHCGESTDVNIHRFWYMHREYREGTHFEIIQPIAVGISELI